MRYLITGATGFLGRRLWQALGAAGHDRVALARDVRRASQTLTGGQVLEWNGVVGLPPPGALDGVDVVVNLIGESVARRWTSERKRRFRDSRVLPTRALVQRMAELEPARRPRALVSMGGTAYYGDREAEVLTEKSTAGGGFLADLARDWESAALAAEALDVRVVVLRTGVVLGRDGGILAKLLPPFRLGLGARLGTGRQYIPWIHLDDMLSLLQLAGTSEALRGPVNAVAPEPVTNAELVAALGEALRRPAALMVPGFALKLAMGEMAEEMLLASQRVSPIKALEAGFEFRFPLLRQALADLLRPHSKPAVAAASPPAA
jgi:uncharacterized protein (TIGR01777 family)